VAIGIMVAWALTVVFVPAYIAFLPARVFENFGASHEHEDSGWLSRTLRGLGPRVSRHAKSVIGVALVLVGVAGFGISRIVIDDNPVKWFAASHPIRVADKVLNEHFAGTYIIGPALCLNINCVQPKPIFIDDAVDAAIPRAAHRAAGLLAAAAVAHLQQQLHHEALKELRIAALDGGDQLGGQRFVGRLQRAVDAFVGCLQAFIRITGGTPCNRLPGGLGVAVDLAGLPDFVAAVQLGQVGAGIEGV